MIFYDCSTAPNPRRARMFLAEKGLTPESHDISIAKGEQLNAAFRAVNPRPFLGLNARQRSKKRAANTMSSQ